MCVCVCYYVFFKGNQCFFPKIAWSLEQSVVVRTVLNPLTPGDCWGNWKKNWTCVWRPLGRSVIKSMVQDSMFKYPFLPCWIERNKSTEQDFNVHVHFPPDWRVQQPPFIPGINGLSRCFAKYSGTSAYERFWSRTFRLTENFFVRILFQFTKDFQFTNKNNKRFGAQRH